MWRGVERLMLSVNATYLNATAPVLAKAGYATPYLGSPAEFNFLLVAYPPGGASPVYGAYNPAGGQDVVVDHPPGGPWLLRVYLLPVSPAAGVCSSGTPGAHAVPAQPDSSTRAAAQNYGLYFGCHPHCFRLA